MSSKVCHNVSRGPASRFTQFKRKIQLFGRIIARRGSKRGGAVMLLMKGRKVEGGVYSCSGYERYHKRRQGGTEGSRSGKQFSALSSNYSTTTHTCYPLLQASFPTVVPSLPKKSSSDWDVTLEEDVLSLNLEVLK